MPTEGLNTNRFALVNEDAVFDTTAPKGKGPGRSYSLDGSAGSSTCGCSCEQILALSEGEKEGEFKLGCSIGIMDNFVRTRCEVDGDRDGFRISDGDCDDTNSATYPDATELCDGVDDDCDGLVPADEADADSDGFRVCEDDCNDADAAILPGATEICDGLDNDCNDQIDEGVKLTFYRDIDGDGYGGTETARACSVPAGYVAAPGDCNDADPAIHPGATELCDGVDDDCDGLVPADEADADSDGFRVCEDDCNDTSPAIHPRAIEICDGLDNDCNDQIDEGVKLTFYRDIDGDGFGSTQSTLACSAPSGYVAVSRDCDDANPAINPGATDVCDGIDNNCDVLIDEGFDQDGDRFTTCAGDCDDNDPNINPGAAEVCDQKDNDCDGTVDEGFDADGDGYPGWYSGCGNDCDDYDALTNPGAAEVCDGEDNDCDGEIDEGVQTTFYKDADGDGSGGQVPVLACSLPAGSSTGSEDCDDINPMRSPDAPEICDGLDNNCNGQVDEGFTLLTFTRDTDGDGFGGTETIQACSAPLEYVDKPGDCNDNDASIYPGAQETCDGKDSNCDGTGDELLESTFYRDGDGDGYGGAESIRACSAPAGYIEISGDCDDDSPAVHPGATEVCDSADNDCNGQIDEGLPAQTLYRDADGDGYGSSTASLQACSGSLPGHVADSTDCDDADRFSNPAATEYCDGKDNDCDGQTDEGLTLTFYHDADVDGFGSIEAVQACSAPAGYVGNSADCDDGDAERNPDRAEVCDGKDNDCDGVADEGFLVDNDHDSYSGCGGDCNDANAAINPGAADTACDSIDQNCNGHDDCDVRFKIDRGAVLDTETGLYWLRNANCWGPGFYDTNGTVPGLFAKVSQLQSGQCGLTDGSSAGDWRFPTMAEMQGLFKKEHCQDAVWGLLCDPKYPWCTDPYEGMTCLGNAKGTARWLPGDPFSNVQIVTGTQFFPHYYSSELSGEVHGQDQYRLAAHFMLHTFMWGGSSSRPDEDYIDWDGGWGVSSKYYGLRYVWPVRDKLVDSDGDGFNRGPDCNDFDPAIHPGATESCDGLDNDCNGRIDEVCDSDGDGYTPDGGDCTESDAYIHPGAAEICDGRDNDCDGQVDEGVQLIFYRDADGDGYGGTATIQACTVPAGYVANSGDCNDVDASVHPGAPDPCDGIDNNCDGRTDEGVQLTFYRDADGDGYGGPATTRACTVPGGYVAYSGDCNDKDALVNPGAAESCDGKDNNCDGQVDEGLRKTYYRDDDNDGYGSTELFSSCTAWPGLVTSGGDCNDHDWTVYPGATETCNGIDDNCNGQVDESEGLVCRFVDQEDGTVLDTKTGLYWLKNAGGLGGGLMFYDQAVKSVDALRDGSGGLSDGSWAGAYAGGETKPPGYTFTGAWRLPTSEEMKDLCGYCGAFCYLSNAGGTAPWREGDAFSGVKQGSKDAYWTSTADAHGDQKIFRLSPICTDHFTMNPDLPAYYWFYAWPVRAALVDTDSDGFRVVEGTTNGPDCDDTNPGVHPETEEVCNHVDDNCVLGVDEICDWDGDGFTPLTGDCNDNNANVHPQQPDPANGIDDNCDGRVDERFSIMGDGTILDNAQGKRWLENPATIPPSTWQGAKDIVAGLGDGLYGLSDGSQPGDWQLPTVAEFNTLADPLYAYDPFGDCQCEVLELPDLYPKCWLKVPTGPALSNAQGDAHWEEGDPFKHVDGLNPSCNGNCQELCQDAWIGGVVPGAEGVVIPWGECVGQSAMCNRNLFWTRETVGAYKGVDTSYTPWRPTRECRGCSSVWGNVVLGVYGDWGQDPGGTCCVTYDINLGASPGYWPGYGCNEKLKVWPWRAA